MTRKELQAVPYRKQWDGEIICKSLIILPQRRLHDSGYRCLDFVAVNKQNHPVCRLSGSSDVVHIEGIGGFGHEYQKLGIIPTSIPIGEWAIDCLPKSGLLRLFCRGEIICGSDLSSFQIWSKPENKNE